MIACSLLATCGNEQHKRCLPMKLSNKANVEERTTHEKSTPTWFDEIGDPDGKSSKPKYLHSSTFHSEGT